MQDAQEHLNLEQRGLWVSEGRGPACMFRGGGNIWAEAEGHGAARHRACLRPSPRYPALSYPRATSLFAMGQGHGLAHRESLAVGNPSSPRRKSPVALAGTLLALAAYKSHTITPTPPHLNDPTSFITKISQNSSHSSHTVFNTNLIPVEGTTYSDNRMFGIVTPQTIITLYSKNTL